MCADVPKTFDDPRLKYRALVVRVDEQLAESCPGLPNEMRIGFAVQIANAALRQRQGNRASVHLHEIGGRSN